MDDQKIHRLLQLKSYEQPSSEAIEQFISEFHRRQEAQLEPLPLIERCRDWVTFFFSELQIPKMAYVGATAVALFCSVLILQTNTCSQNRADSISSALSSENFSAIHHYASPIIEHEAEPVSFDLKKESAEEDAIFSPMSSVLKKKTSAKESLLSF